MERKRGGHQEPHIGQRKRAKQAEKSQGRAGVAMKGHSGVAECVRVQFISFYSTWQLNRVRQEGHLVGHLGAVGSYTNDNLAPGIIMWGYIA